MKHHSNIVGSRGRTHWVILIFLFHLCSSRHVNLTLSYSRQLGFSKQLQIYIHLVAPLQRQFTSISAGRCQGDSYRAHWDHVQFLNQSLGEQDGEGAFYYEWPNSIAIGQQESVINSLMGTMWVGQGFP